MTAILLRLLSWLSDGLPSVTIRVLRVPADGSTPHILPLQTIKIYAEGNVDCFLFHIPDMRGFWGTGEAWKWRDLARAVIEDQSPVVNGCYYAFMSFADHLLPLNKAASGCGDVFIAKVTDAEYEEHGWATYDDVPEELLGSGLYKRVLEPLAAL